MLLFLTIPVSTLAPLDIGTLCMQMGAQVEMMYFANTKCISVNDNSKGRNSKKGSQSYKFN